MANYTQTEGTPDGLKHFQDIALTPANIKSGALRRRLDTRDFPKVGKKFALPAPDLVSISPTSVAKTATVTNKVLTSNVATLTIGAHFFAVGSSIVVASVDAAFDGTFTVTAVTATTVSYAKVNADVASGADTGTVTGSPTLDVTLVGEHLELGAVVAFSAAGVTVNRTSRKGDKDRGLVANITVASGAAATARDVTVTNLDAGTDTLSAAFTINA